MPAAVRSKAGVKAEPDWTHVHRELRRPGVTLMLLWEEYRTSEPGGYSYSRWCELHRAWEGRLSPTMRQSHPAGERMFVDYAGQTIELIDGRSGEIRQAQIFVAVMGASSYTLAFAGAGSMPRRAGHSRCPLDWLARSRPRVHGRCAGAARAR
jgi:transposase